MHILRCFANGSGLCLRGLSSCATPSIRTELQETCRRFANDVLRPIAYRLDQTRCFPREQISELGRLGLMAVTAPTQYGGSNLDMLSLSLAVEELSQGCASTGAIVSIHNILYIDLLGTQGSERQKELYLTPYTKGTPGAFALSESEAGSDVANISCTATKKGDDFVLNGTKSWVTSAQEAEVAIIFSTVDKNQGANGITGKSSATPSLKFCKKLGRRAAVNKQSNKCLFAAFLVPLKQDGVHVSEPDDKLGIRATSTCQINLCDVLVPQENILGGVGNGFKIAMLQLNKARIGIASQALGIAQASLDTALEYAMCRQAFGKQLVTMQAVQVRLARMAAQIEAARLLVRQSAKLCDRKQNIIKSSAIAKLVASEAATFAAHQCIQILGGMGYTESMPAERYYRDARITEIYGGVSDIQMLIIAEQLIKERKPSAAN